jgi:hypothetical protein
MAFVGPRPTAGASVLSNNASCRFAQHHEHPNRRNVVAEVWHDIAAFIAWQSLPIPRSYSSGSKSGYRLNAISRFDWRR